MAASTGDPDADAVIASYAAPAPATGDADADAVIQTLRQVPSSSRERQRTERPVSQTAYGAAQAAASGLNAGVADLIGLPVDTARNVIELGKAGAGFALHELTGRDIPGFLQTNETPDAFSSQWLKDKLSGIADTSARENTPLNRYLHAAGEVVPGALSGNEGGTVGALRAGSAGAVTGLSQQGAADLGADPASQAALGMLAGHAASAGARSLPRLSASGAPEVAATQALLNRAVAGRSVGAASTAPDIAGASPELQKAVADAARKTGGAVNPEVLKRRLEADSLPVRIPLTEGQATQDPTILSNEQNLRGKHPELAQAFNAQNQALSDNFRAIREAAGPDVFTTQPVEHGDTLIQAYKAKADAADADISQKYQALRDANGGQFPVDAPALLKNATDQLHQQLLFDHAPKAVMATLGRLADANNMTFENFESLRTNLARIQRSSQDGNEVAAAGVIRNAMENLPLQEGAAQLKPLADSARAAAKTQFDALEADPAYKAAVEDKVPPDRFVQKFIVGAPRDDVATMRSNLADNDRAVQTMGVAALDHLRRVSGLDELGNGNVSQAALNKNLNALRPKMASLLPPEQAQQIDALANVARYTQAQPKGSFVNNSNTLVGALAGHGVGALEGMANVAAKGLPVGTLIRKGFENRAAGKTVKRALNPASGLERLTETDQRP